METFIISPPLSRVTSTTPPTAPLKGKLSTPGSAFIPLTDINLSPGLK